MSLVYITPGTITHLVINVENDELYFTIDRIIYRQKLYQTASTLFAANNQVTGKLIYKHFGIIYKYNTSFKNL
jgi:hypothetical protein